MSSNNPAQFNFYLNRQGAQGKQGEKGDQGFSPSITEGKNTLSEYTLLITNQTGTFETANLREHKEDRQGTYMRYDRTKGVEYAGAADVATEDNAGVVRLSGQDDFDNLGDETVLTPYRMATANPLNLAYVDTMDETNSGRKAMTRFETDIQTSESGGVTSTTIASDVYRYVESWENGMLADYDKDYYLRQSLVRSTDGSVTVTNWQEKGIDLSVNFPPAYTLPIATPTTLGGVKIGEGLEISEDGTVTVTGGGGGGSYVLPPATADTLGGIKVGENLTIEADGTLNAVAGSYTLPAATTTTLGGVKPDGTTITVTDDGTISSVGGGGAPANMVTTDTEQTISGEKTFTSSIHIDNDILTSDGFRIANGGLGDNRVSIGDSNAGLTLYSNNDIKVSNSTKEETLIHTGNIGDYAATTEDLANKADKFNAVTPLLLTSNSYNPDNVVQTSGTNFQVKTGNVSGEHTIPALLGQSATDRFTFTFPSDANHTKIDWTKVAYFNISDITQYTFQNSRAASGANRPSMLFGRKNSDGTFEAKLYVGAWLNTNSGAKFSSIMKLSGETSSSAYDTEGYTGIRYVYAGDMPSASNGDNLQKLGVAFAAGENNNVTAAMYIDGVKKNELNLAMTTDELNADINCVVFEIASPELIPTANVGAFTDNTFGTQVWNPTQAVISASDLSIDTNFLGGTNTAVTLGNSGSDTTIYASGDIKAVINGGTSTTIATQLDLQAVVNEIGSTTDALEALDAVAVVKDDVATIVNGIYPSSSRKINILSQITESGATYTPTTAGILCIGKVSGTTSGQMMSITSASQYMRDYAYCHADGEVLACNLPVVANVPWTITYTTASLTYAYFYPYNIPTIS